MKFLRKNQREFLIDNESGLEFEEIVTSSLFENWLKSLDSEFVVVHIRIQSADKLGDHIRFIKMKATIKNPAGQPQPGIIFLRGDSVAILPVLRCDSKLYTLLAVQARTPTGHYRFREIPAGTLEGESFSGTAIREMKEETGLDLNTFEITRLTHQPIYLSPGACDEKMQFFAAEKTLTESELQALQGKVTGLAEEGEHIKLQVIPLDDLGLVADAKSMLAWALYRTRIYPFNHYSIFN